MGSQIAFNKIGFHVGSGGNKTGYGDYVRSLDEAGIPAVCMSVGGEGLGDIVSQWDKGSQVNHVAVVRYMPSDGSEDVPPYGQDVKQAAVNWWVWQKKKIGSEVKKYKDRIWIKMGNELDKNEAEWLGRFYIELANLMNSDPEGPFKLVAFNYSAGEPEPSHWEIPSVLDYLRLCEERPSQCAIGLHEYSYSDILSHDITHQIGRFSALHAVCDQHSIARPNILIHEFGWRQNVAPDVSIGMKQVPQISEIYAQHPNILGAGIWTLQTWHSGEIYNTIQKYIEAIRDFTLGARFPVGESIPEPPQTTPLPPIDDNYHGQARVSYDRTVWVVPQNITKERWLEVAGAAFEKKRSISFSYDDAGIGEGLAGKTAVLYDIETGMEQAYLDWYSEHYPDTAVEFEGVEEEDTPFKFTHWPTAHRHVTQPFGARPEVYQKWGLPAHEGVDIRAPHGSPIYAVADGVVSDLHAPAAGHNYGRFIRLDHGGGYETTYAHLDRFIVYLGQKVSGGQLIGYADSTGNSSGSHLHLTVKKKGHGYTDEHGNEWPYDIADPTPMMQHFSYSQTAQAIPPPKPLSYHGPAVTFSPALHAPGSDWMWHDATIRGMFDRVDIPVKFMSNGDSWKYFGQYKSDDFELVRIFWQPDRAKTAVEAWNDVKDGVMAFYNAGARKFEVLNEPNLTQEGMGLVWKDGDSFGQWLSDFIDILNVKIPEAKLYYPGLSPGVPWTNQFTFTDKAWPHVRDKLYGACIHAYTGIVDNETAAIADIVNQVEEAQVYKWLDRPLVVSECSVNRAATAEYKARVYRGIEEGLGKVDGLEGVVWYISHWLPPKDQASHAESWLSLGIDKHY